MPGMDPAMFGMGGPGAGGGMPDPMNTPGPPNPMSDPALQALDGLSPKSSNPTQSMQKMAEALDLAYRLVSTVISQAQMTSPKAVKAGHGIARSILSMKSDLFTDTTPGPTPDLMLGMGMAGSSGGQTNSQGSGTSMSGMP